MRTTTLQSTTNVEKPNERRSKPQNEFSREELDLVGLYRRAKKLGYADIAITIQNGARVKLWLTEKIK